MNIYVIVYHESRYDEHEFEIVGAFTNRKKALLALVSSNSYQNKIEIVKDGEGQEFNRETITHDEARIELAAILGV